MILDNFENILEEGILREFEHINSISTLLSFCEFDFDYIKK